MLKELVKHIRLFDGVTRIFSEKVRSTKYTVHHGMTSNGMAQSELL